MSAELRIDDRGVPWCDRCNETLDKIPCGHEHSVKLRKLIIAVPKLIDALSKSLYGTCHCQACNVEYLDLVASVRRGD